MPTERNISRLYEGTLLFKALHAAIEIVGGVAVLVLNSGTFTLWVTQMTQGELIEDPHDAVASFVLQGLQHVSSGGVNFASLYLISHVVINAVIVYGLLKGKSWSYSLAYAVLAAFTLYQLYRLTHAFSWWLVVLTVIDVLVIGLIYREHHIELEAKKVAV